MRTPGGNRYWLNTYIPHTHVGDLEVGMPGFQSGPAWQWWAFWGSKPTEGKSSLSPFFPLSFSPFLSVYIYYICVCVCILKDTKSWGCCNAFANASCVRSQPCNHLRGNCASQRKSCGEEVVTHTFKNQKAAGAPAVWWTGRGAWEEVRRFVTKRQNVCVSSRIIIFLF